MAGLRVMAIDGIQLDVPDIADNEDEFGRGVSLGLDAPYPKVKVLGLGECHRRRHAGLVARTC